MFDVRQCGISIYMIHIKYKLDKSPIHGIGIFADQNIKKGQLIFTAEPILDVNITDDQFSSLNDAEKKEIKYWGYFNKFTNKWHVDFDHIHFLNHSYSPNTTQNTTSSEACLIASRDISLGEELTQNYLEFETEEDLKNRGIKIEKFS